jgi:hypothetical protein
MPTLDELLPKGNRTTLPILTNFKATIIYYKSCYDFFKRNSDNFSAYSVLNDLCNFIVNDTAEEQRVDLPPELVERFAALCFDENRETLIFMRGVDGDSEHWIKGIPSLMDLKPALRPTEFYEKGNTTNIVCRGFYKLVYICPEFNSHLGQCYEQKVCVNCDAIPMLRHFPRQVVNKLTYSSWRDFTDKVLAYLEPYAAQILHFVLNYVEEISKEDMDELDFILGKGKYADDGYKEVEPIKGREGIPVDPEESARYRSR